MTLFWGQTRAECEKFKGKYVAAQFGIEANAILSCTCLQISHQQQQQPQQQQEQQEGEGEEQDLEKGSDRTLTPESTKCIIVPT